MNKLLRFSPVFQEIVSDLSEGHAKRHKMITGTLTYREYHNIEQMNIREGIEVLNRYAFYLSGYFFKRSENFFELDYIPVEPSEE